MVVRWLVCAAWLLAASAQAQTLPSWNEGPAKQAIVQFVTDVTTPDTPTFVPAEARIAVFDNDGTLWAEQPLYVQFVFMLDQIMAAAPKHPEWKTNPAFKALVARDHQRVAALGHKPLLELLAVASVWYLAMTTAFSFLQAELEAWLRPEEERRGLRGIIERALAPPDQWLGGLADRR